MVVVVLPCAHMEHSERRRQEPSFVPGETNRVQEELGRLRAASVDDMPRKERVTVERKIALLESSLRRLETGDVGRRIPDAISEAVIERDRTRDFGRPDHACEGVRPPHHIRHFETFKGAQTRENPHTVDNLEAPCADCHKLAHALAIPSGVSVETLFRAFDADGWKEIERLWKGGETAGLKNMVSQSFVASAAPADRLGHYP